MKKIFLTISILFLTVFCYAKDIDCNFDYEYLINICEDYNIGKYEAPKWVDYYFNVLRIKGVKIFCIHNNKEENYVRILTEKTTYESFFKLIMEIIQKYEIKITDITEDTYYTPSNIKVTGYSEITKLSYEFEFQEYTRIIIIRYKDN